MTKTADAWCPIGSGALGAKSGSRNIDLEWRVSCESEVWIGSRWRRDVYTKYLTGLIRPRFKPLEQGYPGSSMEARLQDILGPACYDAIPPPDTRMD